MVTVGITAVGGGVGQSVLRALDHSRMKLRVVGMDAQPMSVGLYWTDASYLIPPVRNTDAYLSELKTIVQREGIDLLIPGLDTALPTLAAHVHEFHELGCELVISSPEVVGLVRDKRACYHFARERGLPFVLTLTLAEAQAQAAELDYPVIAKPKGGSASAGVKLIGSATDLLEHAPDEGLIIQTYLPPKIGGDGLERLELDQSNEVSIQYYVNRHGEVVGDGFTSVNRLKAGIPIEIVPSRDPSAWRDGLPLVEALAERGLRGPINLQGRATATGLRFFELNARFTGITMVRAAMGYREVEAAIRDLVLGQEQEVAACLRPDLGFIGMRYPEQVVVPAERIQAVAPVTRAAPPARERSPHTVLVTGANGYLGAQVVETLLAALPEVHLVAAIRAGAEASLPSHPRLSHRSGELPHAVWDLSGVDTVVHLAALRPPHVRPGESAPLYTVNVEGTRLLLEAAREAGVERFVFLSSQSVYSGRATPWSEAEPLAPKGPYALSKWMAEQLCRAESELDTVILRAGRIYGLGRHLRWHELGQRLPYRTARGEALELTGDGSQQLDMLHVRDLAAAVLRACLAPLPGGHDGIFNIASGLVSVARLADICRQQADALGLPMPPIEYVSPTEPASLPIDMDVRLAARMLGWHPTVPLEAGLRELIRAALDRPQTSTDAVSAFG